MKDRWYKWYPARYRGKTMHLTLEQDGLYRRFIDHYMETGDPLPDNEGALARIAGVPLATLHELLPVLMPFFDRSGGVLRLRRCDLQLSQQNSSSEKHSSNGRMGGTAKAAYQKSSPVENTENSSHRQKSSQPLPAPEREETKDQNKKDPPKGGELSRTEAEMFFARLWQEYPAWSGREGGFQFGNVHKGSRKKAFDKFYILLKKEKDHEQFTRTLIIAAVDYGNHLQNIQWQASAHLVTWLNQERWRDCYDSQPAARGGSMGDAIAQGFSRALRDAGGEG